MSTVQLNLEVEQDAKTVAVYKKTIEMDGYPTVGLSIAEVDTVLVVASVQYVINGDYYYCRLFEGQEVDGTWDFLIEHGWVAGL